MYSQIMTSTEQNCFLHQHPQAALPEQKELLPHTSQVADDLQHMH